MEVFLQVFSWSITRTNFLWRFDANHFFFFFLGEVRTSHQTQGPRGRSLCFFKNVDVTLCQCRSVSCICLYRLPRCRLCSSQTPLAVIPSAEQHIPYRHCLYVMSRARQDQLFIIIFCIMYSCTSSILHSTADTFNLYIFRCSYTLYFHYKERETKGSSFFLAQPSSGHSRSWVQNDPRQRW